MLLRAKLMDTSDAAERVELRKKSSQLAHEAVELDPTSGAAHSCLGNSLFLEFFNTGQMDSKLLTQACDEYRLALQCGKEYRNADLHLNAGAAFRYEENYSEALEHLQLAVKYDPSDVIGSHSRLASLTKFLSSVAAGVQNTAVVARVVSTIAHDEGVPVASVIMDVEGDCVALCVYNCAQTFSFFVGDTVAVADPHVIEVKDLELPSSSTISFRSIRVPNPSMVSRNGNLPKPTQMAPSHLKISAL
ncbi:unnamed protein product [Cylicostephanus goldi]|uniref:Tetratricopeptide repeat protein 5 OB fold domain-containing protein n=1 Tax=Cylicostephanus goldi TaxID=71465 RepID=A0A3P7MUB2_CYLGO|nr:unnamed protein product [Cylicostephanus goldi]